MPKLLLLFFVISVNNNLWAQEKKDTFRYGPDIYKEAAFKESNWSDSGYDISLDHKYIQYDSFYNLVGALMIAENKFKRFLKPGRMEIPVQASINDCEIVLNDTLLDNFDRKVDNSLDDFLYGGSHYGLHFNEGIEIFHCTSKDPLTIAGITTPAGKTLQFRDNKIRWLSLDSLDCAEVFFTTNDMKLITIGHSKIDDLSLSSNSSSDTIMLGKELDDLFLNLQPADANREIAKMFFLKIDSSDLSSVEVTNPRAELVYLAFTGCKLEKSFSFMDTLHQFASVKEMVSFVRKAMKTPFAKTKFLEVGFEGCEINGEISNPIHDRRSKFTFEKCVFGDRADLQNMNFDTLTISNCFKIMSPLYLPIPDSGDVYISIINSDLKNIRFDYTPHVHLIADVYGDGNEDMIGHSYISLLEKFKAEGKLKSYENLDVEYKQWQYTRQGFFGRIANAVDRYWWYYGYRKWYILYWSVIFLLLFTILNFVWWDKFNQVYPVPGKNNESYFEKLNYRSMIFRKTVHVFLATSFVFLSFRVELDRLNYKKSSMLLYFFLQYIIGLICLFFIVNAILKI